MISGNRDEAWPMYHLRELCAWVIRWHVTCMLSLAEHWQGRRALSNHICAHSVISVWHVVCLQHLARACIEQSRSTTVLPINHVIQMPQCLSGFVNHDYYTWGLAILADSLLFSVNNILAGLWLNCISSVEITLFLLADILLQHRALFQC